MWVLLAPECTSEQIRKMDYHDTSVTCNHVVDVVELQLDVDNVLHQRTENRQRVCVFVPDSNERHAKVIRILMRPYQCRFVINKDYVNVTSMRNLLDEDEHMLVVPQKWRSWVSHARACRRLIRKFMDSDFPWNVFSYDVSKSLGEASFKLLPLMNDIQQGRKIKSRICCSHYPFDAHRCASSGVLIRAGATHLNEVTMICEPEDSYVCCTFDAKKYKDLNFDLRGMTDVELTRHFVHHGWRKENRMFSYPPNPINELPVRRDKEVWSCVALLNHASDVSGAPWVCYSIFAELVDQKVDDVFLFTPHVCPVLMDKLNLSKNARARIIEFKHNPHALLDAIRKLSVDTLVVNSFSSEFLSLFPEVHACVGRVVQYVHEDYQDYIPNQVSDVAVNGDILLTADHATARSFRKNKLKSYVYPPKFRMNAYTELIRKRSVYDTICETGLGKYWTLSTHRVIGMVGTPNERKNFDYFCKLARTCPQYVFVWIGGDATKWLSTNVLLVEKTPHVTTYMRLFDVFLLTSNRDYCPVVLLEALAMDIPCIAFKDALMYRHRKCAHLHLLKGRIQDKDPQVFEPLFEAAMKTRNDQRSGSEYIKRYFVYTKGEVRKRLGVMDKN